MSPAIEPIYFGQKPFSEKTGTKNIQKWGAGAINIDGNRIGKSKRVPVSPSRLTNGVSLSGSVDGSLRKMTGKESGFNPNIGRWPANVITDGSDPVLSACPEASYLFYEAKADANDRIGSNHPTVKPLSLIRHLVKLVCPKSGTILDPFGGTGTTAEAAFREGINTILIEYDPEYQADIRKRIRVMQEGGYARDVAKMARKPTLKDQGLFGELTHANQTRRTATKTRNGRARALRP